MIPEKYRKWQSLKGEEGHLSKINLWLGGNVEGDPWGGINSYLPKTEDKYANFKILSKYSVEKEGIEVLFMGEFERAISRLSKQVVFKISDNDENVLIAQLLNGKEEYTLELPANYQVVSLTMTRIPFEYKGVIYESALVSMKWAWTGEIEKGDGIKTHDSELQWIWHPYEPEL
jgi:hypothetical protein